MSAALTAEGLNTFYGKSHILRRGSGHGPARPQRRRQDHDVAQPDGLTPPREGRVSVFGRETTRRPFLPTEEKPLMTNQSVTDSFPIIMGPLKAWPIQIAPAGGSRWTYGR